MSQKRKSVAAALMTRMAAMAELELFFGAEVRVVIVL
jgi:hypothetical protein